MPSWKIHFHAQQRRAISFPLRIGLERHRTAAVETLMQQEIQRAQIRHLKPLHLAVTNAAKMFLHARGSDLRDENRIILRLQRNQSNVSGVAFVPRAGVRDFEKFHASHDFIETSASTAVFGSSAGPY